MKQEVCLTSGSSRALAPLWYSWQQPSAADSHVRDQARKHNAFPVRETEENSDDKSMQNPHPDNKCVREAHREN